MITLEGPETYVGLPDGTDGVLIIFNPGTDAEVQVHTNACGALAMAQILSETGFAAMARDTRRQQATSGAIEVARAQPIRLDS